ncbi:MAG: pentapeptide repeat-containing protein [Leptolyngbya sp. SIO4C5]|nr:pentapeptide repeat-containing protein [Leptolyngbya sp. SIO4C5]
MPQQDKAFQRFFKGKFIIPICFFLLSTLLFSLWSIQQDDLSKVKSKIEEMQNLVEQEYLSQNIDIDDKLSFEKDLLSLEKDRVSAENAIYGTLIQTLGGIFFFVTAYFTWRNVKTAEANLKATEDKQITERFSRAIEQLSSERLESRLGAIYALERVAEESPKDEWVIIELLTCFIRANLSNIETSKSELNVTPNSPDIQAILSFVGRCSLKYDHKGRKINLSHVNFSRGKLRFFEFINANLRGANFEEAYLGETNLSGADLRYSNFQNVNSKRDYLPVKEINFTKARLIQAQFNGAQLQRSTFVRADLEGAILKNTSLFQVDFSNASLVEADLSNADLSRANFRGANLSGAKLDHADIQGADFTGARGLSPNRVEVAKNYSQAIFDDGFLQKLG